eukprot:CAMPEP_0116842650 /NCGR_PEP_ID=MMETSP0418-20121206/11640_1 /TAXON_ID=1158023 /ORGANISM="Astrosyne radiata, Strain 13vi08-1A" /LENGTH=114 /DNA_ID=CAMNT_0004473295 /DNA_START=386 /DNA_END=730 /DNA_ORIENTATION=+
MTVSPSEMVMSSCQSPTKDEMGSCCKPEQPEAAGPRGPYSYGTFDGDETLYSDGANLEPNPTLPDWSLSAVLVPVFVPGTSSGCLESGCRFWLRRHLSTWYAFLLSAKSSERQV